MLRHGRARPYPSYLNILENHKTTMIHCGFRQMVRLVLAALREHDVAALRCSSGESCGDDDAVSVSNISCSHRRVLTSYHAWPQCTTVLAVLRHASHVPSAWITAASKHVVRPQVPCASTCGNSNLTAFLHHLESPGFTVRRLQMHFRDRAALGIVPQQLRGGTSAASCSPAATAPLDDS